MFENFRITALAVVPVLGFLIFVHELGHFLAARWMGVRVLEFGFGYPPRMLKLFERDGVEYTLNWLPFGGFVRMAGEDGDFETEGSLAAVSPWRRIVVLAAGPVMNILTAVFLFALLLMVGTPQYTGDYSQLPVFIAVVAPDSPAQQAGLQPGDIIESVNGEKVRGLDNVREVIRMHAGKEIEITVRRDDELITVRLRPRLPEEIPPGQGPMGVQIRPSIPPEDLEIVRANPIEAIVGGMRETVRVVFLMAEALASLLRALILPSVSAPEGGVGGLVAIGRVTAEVAQQGWRQLVNLTAFLSINLAIINLLPIPALDGGRILFALVEIARRKRIPPEKEALIHFAGYALLLALMLAITFMDISNWIAGRPPIPGG